MVEVDKASFSIEPMLKINDELLNWSNVTSTQSLEENYLPIPKVTWNTDKINLDIKIFANGEANKNSNLYLEYTITNNSSSPQIGNLFLLIRPFQVNPYYQFLNLQGGAGKISSIRENNGKVYVNQDKVILPITKYSSFGASSFDEGNIVDELKGNKFPESKSISVSDHLASGVLKYDFELKQGEDKIVYISVPFYGEEFVKENLTKADVEKKLTETIDFWKSEINHIKFNLPKSADRIINSYKSNLAYILINRDEAESSRVHDRMKEAG